MSNAEIAAKLLSLAQLLSSQGENPFKVRAYRRAAETLRNLAESIDGQVRQNFDLTQHPGIGKAIAGAIREIVLSGSLEQLETLRGKVSPELAALSEHPRLDPKRVLQIYRKLKIGTIDELKARLESGELGEKLGLRIEHHVRQALTERQEILLVDADEIAGSVRSFLLRKCGATRVDLAGQQRRRVEVIGELTLLVETPDFSALVEGFTTFGGRTDLVSSGKDTAAFRHSSGILLTLDAATSAGWGAALIRSTGSEGHLHLLEKRGFFPPRGRRAGKSLSNPATEGQVYRSLGLAYIEPELREGRDEVDLAARGLLPKLVSVEDIRGELHAHSTSSDGAHSIEEMAAAAQARHYQYLGITDHSKSLKIAGGVSEADLWKQIRRIDRLNLRRAGGQEGFRILKSAEVDILADGSLDYPDELLRELDYTVCSIHSRFALDKRTQTERILRAMDNRYFTILGHATGRLLLRRPGYSIDLERILAHAKERGCFLEINASPDRLDLSSENARAARDAGVKIAICTDAHSTPELDYLRCGIDQARRAGLESRHVLNCLALSELLQAFRG